MLKSINDEITTQLIFEAYKKFKNYCYYDNTSMFTRQVIAEFEKKFFDEKNIGKDFRSIFMNNDHIVRIKQVIKMVKTECLIYSWIK